jgi:hypothetical protein
MGRRGHMSASCLLRSWAVRNRRIAPDPGLFFSLVRGADVGIKPGVERSETPRPPAKICPEPAKRPVEFAIPYTSFAIDYRSPASCSCLLLLFLLSPAPRAFITLKRRVPGVPLRFTPGFMPSPASRVIDFRVRLRRALTTDHSSLPQCRSCDSPQMF